MTGDTKADADIEYKLKEAYRKRACVQAKKNYLNFLQLMHPDIKDPGDYRRSNYDVKEFHKIIADTFQLVTIGLCKRVILCLPPRNGKTEAAAKKGIAYYFGHHPQRHVIYATYGGDLSKECGADVIHTMKTERYKEVFPTVTLRKGGSSKDRVQTEQGGVGIFVGRGGAVSGKGAHLLVVDDLVKDDEEANSPATMEKCWQWYNKVATNRLMDDKSAIIIIMTRWGDNDIVGRITDPDSPNFDPEEAAKWKIIRIPALCDDPENDPLKREYGEPLWPEKFSKEFLEGMRRQDPRGFSCLQQQNPSPDDGVFFSAESIKEYKFGDQPPVENLRIYASSDYAVSTKQNNDSTVLLVVGVDSHQNIWILDAWWHKMPADKIVRAQLDMIKKWKPITWWAEKGHISKSIMPFMRKRMMDERIFCAIEEVVPSGDKQTRAQSIKGYMAMGKVYFPRQAHWFGAAQQQILKFGGGSRFDDFVDALSLIGLGLAETVGKRPASGFVEKFKPGSFGDFKEHRKRDMRQKKLNAAGAGFRGF